MGMLECGSLAVSQLWTRALSVAFCGQRGAVFACQKAQTSFKAGLGMVSGVHFLGLGEVCVWFQLEWSP